MSDSRTFDEAVLDLFSEAETRTGERACQVICDGRWRTVPLEWNGAMRLAELCGTQAQMIDKDGDPFRAYPEEKAHA